LPRTATRTCTRTSRGPSLHPAHPPVSTTTISGLDRLVQDLPVGVIVQGPRGDFIYANPLASELLGLTQDQLLGKSVLDPDWRVVRDDGSPFAPQDFPVTRALATGRPVRDVVMGVVRPALGDVSWLLVRADPQLHADGRLERVIITYTDISGLKATEDELTRTLRDAQRLRRALDHVPAYVYIKDHESRYVYTNALCLDLFGVPADAIPGLRDSDIFPASTTDRLREVDRRVLAGEYTREELELVDDAGRPRVYLELKTPLRDDQDPNAVTAILGVSVDITEQREREERTREAQRLEAIGRLAGGVAHDFNNMLGVILGRAELCLTDLPEGDPMREDLTDIAAAARRSAELTKQLLAFARRQALSPAVSDLSVAVSQPLRLLRRLIPEDIAVEWSPGATGLVFVDPVQLDQIVTNLCVNARDAILAARDEVAVPRAHDVIHVSTSDEHVDAAFAAQHPTASPGDYVVLRVRDNGTGIPAEHLPRVFEPFFTTKPIGQGTGLGLAMVFGTVQQSGGFVVATSSVGVGTTLAVYLPRHRGVAEATEEHGAAPALRGGTESILVVEDEVALLRMAEHTLTRLGYEVLAAESPAAAIARLAERGSSVDLVVTDVVMPGMNGSDLVAALRGSYPDLRYIYMSGYAADVIPASEASPRFLHKPFSVAALARAVRAALDHTPD